jgi:hypothetical protein
MSTQSDQINDSLTELQSALTDADNDGPYSQALEDKLNDTTLLLQTVQNNLLKLSEQTLLDSLNNCNTQLKQLNADIDAFITKLDSAAATIKKVSDAIGTTVSVIGAVVSAGII